MYFFFFSSRRRHTRSDRDWSSDVCSSDLVFFGLLQGQDKDVLALQQSEKHGEKCQPDKCPRGRRDGIQAGYVRSQHPHRRDQDENADAVPDQKCRRIREPSKGNKEQCLERRVSIWQGAIPDAEVWSKFLLEAVMCL